MDERRAPKRKDTAFLDPTTPRRRLGQLRHPREVDEVDPLADLRARRLTANDTG